MKAPDFGNIFGDLGFNPEEVNRLLAGICRCGVKAALKLDERTGHALCGNCHLASALKGASK